MAFAYSQGIHMSEATQAPPNLRPSLGTGQSHSRIINSSNAILPSVLTSMPLRWHRPQGSATPIAQTVSGPKCSSLLVGTV